MQKRIRKSRGFSGWKIYRSTPRWLAVFNEQDEEDDFSFIYGGAQENRKATTSNSEGN
jgi:hypothetical protein